MVFFIITCYIYISKNLQYLLVQAYLLCRQSRHPLSDSLSEINMLCKNWSHLAWTLSYLSLLKLVKDDPSPTPPTTQLLPTWIGFHEAQRGEGVGLLHPFWFFESVSASATFVKLKTSKQIKKKPWNEHEISLLLYLED